MNSDDLHKVLQDARRVLDTLDGESVHAVSTCLRSLADRLEDAGPDEEALMWNAAVFDRQQARRYLDLVGVLVVVLDASHRVQFINRAGCELLGLREDEILGLPWLDSFVAEETRVQSETVLDRIVEGKSEASVKLENALLTPIGERWIAWRVGLVYDQYGCIQGTLSSGEDVTDQREAERLTKARVIERTANLQAVQKELERERDKLVHEKERAQLYLDVTRVALLALDREGFVTMINPAGCELLEMTEEKIVGKSWFDTFVVARERGTWRGMFAELVRTGQQRAPDGESHVQTGNGGERLIAWHTAVLRDDKGDVIGTLTCGEDITASRRAEEALQKQEAQLQFITDSLPVLIARVDMQARYQFNNAAYESFFGVSLEELKGRHVRDIIGAQTFDACYPHFEEALSGASPVFELQFTDKEQKLRDMLAKLVPDRDAAGEIVGIYAVITDMTERKQLERALNQSQKMEALGRLASGIAHDFNNLLMGIGGCSNLALSRLEEDSPARIFVDEIRSAATSGASISRQLLDLAGTRRQEVSEVCLDALVAETEAILRRMLSADLSLHFDLHAGKGRIRLAPGQLKQVLMNLLVNARDATPPGGRIDVETHIVEIGAVMSRSLGGITPGPYLVLRVRDTGTGMDPETVERIFEPFFTTKQIDEGTGLGLSTVYGIVSGVGGYIDVQSIVGTGSVMSVYFPMGQPATHVLQDKKVQTARGSETILVVEDDRLVQLAVREYLDRSGYRVLEARDGNEAVRVAREHPEPIPLLISDMVLPGMSGSEVARAVVEIHPEARVIYMSAHPHKMLVEAGHIRAGDECEPLQKPFGEEELLNRVQEVLLSAPSSASRTGAPSL